MNAASIKILIPIQANEIKSELPVISTPQNDNLQIPTISRSQLGKLYS